MNSWISREKSQMKEQALTKDFFGTQKRFADVEEGKEVFILDRDVNVFGKTLRMGSVIRVIAWREVDNEPYLVVSKDTWESLIKYEDIVHLLKK
jgi:uncharacterized secreted protein with C-terminal beta-propeller domain